MQEKFLIRMHPFIFMQWKARDEVNNKKQTLKQNQEVKKKNAKQWL